MCGCKSYLIIYSESDALPDQIDCIIEDSPASFKLAQSKPKQHRSLLVRVFRRDDAGDLGRVQLPDRLTFCIRPAEQRLGGEVRHGQEAVVGGGGGEVLVGGGGVRDAERYVDLCFHAVREINNFRCGGFVKGMISHPLRKTTLLSDGQHDLVGEGSAGHVGKQAVDVSRGLLGRGWV